MPWKEAMTLSSRTEFVNMAREERANIQHSAPHFIQIRFDI